MLPAIDVRLHAALEKFFDPARVFMGFLDGFEQLPAKLLHIMLLKRLLTVPLKTSEQRFGVACLALSLEIDKKFL